MITLAAELLEQSPDGIVVHDGAYIMAVNAATLRLVGATEREQVVGLRVGALFEHPHLKGVEKNLVAGTIRRTAPGFVRERLYRLDGAVHEVDGHAQLFIDDGRPAVFLVLHDVHDQVVAERSALERVEASRAAASMAEARNLAAGVAHVLNNRLQIILGFANFLAEEPLTSQQHLDVEQIIKAAMDGAEVTRQLLQSAGGASCSRELVALDVLVPTLLERLVAPGMNARHSLPVIVEPVPRVLVDPGHVRFMLSYLLSNARRATRTRGRIECVVRSVTVTHPQLASDGQRLEIGRYTTIELNDTGDGISADTQFHMFEPFHTTARIGEGNGLGLSAVQGLLRQNGGFLTFASTLGVGSRFTLWFPEGGHSAADVAAHLDPEPRIEATILVIDSDAGARMVVKRSLERVGYRVLEASTPAEASEMVAHLNCPVLIVVAEVIARRADASLTQLRAHCPAVPMLVLTTGASAEGPGGAAADVASLTTRIASPYSDYVLVSRVRALLGSAA